MVQSKCLLLRICLNAHGSTNHSQRLKVIKKWFCAHQRWSALILVPSPPRRHHLAQPSHTLKKASLRFLNAIHGFGRRSRNTTQQQGRSSCFSPSAAAFSGKKEKWMNILSRQSAVGCIYSRLWRATSSLRSGWILQSVAFISARLFTHLSNANIAKKKNPNGIHRITRGSVIKTCLMSDKWWCDGFIVA